MAFDPQMAFDAGRVRETATATPQDGQGADLGLGALHASARSRKGQADDIRGALQAHGGALTSDAAHAIAARGIHGSGGALPHGDTIQQSFGRHDVSDIRAHTGGAAAEASRALGAEAYATGRDVAFSGPPDVHTAAHEAAHVVQQRHGVSLRGGVGQSGDAYEKHADAVADRVVQGRSAEDLLDRGAGGGGPGLQRKLSGAAVQFEDGQMCTENGAGVESAEPGLDVSLVSGTYVQVSVGAKIPIMAGLTVDVSLTGKYTQGTEGTSTFIEAEGIVQLGLSYKLVFLQLSLFMRGGLKFKVRNASSWEAAFKSACDDISHWVAANHLADLPAKKEEIKALYDDFGKEIGDEFDWISDESAAWQRKDLTTFDDGVFDDSALTNILEARTDLIADVRDIFADLDGNVRVLDKTVYPGSTWIVSQVDAHSDGKTITKAQIQAVRNTLVAEAQARSNTLQQGLNAIPAVSNNPDVEFEANAQVGGKVGFEAGETEGSIELGLGLRIKDEMDASAFDTSSKKVWFASIEVTGMIGNTSMKGQLAYEGIGDKATEPKAVKVTGQVLAGVSEEFGNDKEHGWSLVSVGERLAQAGRGAAKGGQEVLQAIRKSLTRTMEQNRDVPWKSSSNSRAGLSVELKFKRGSDGEMGIESVKVEFVSVSQAGGSVGVLEGSVEVGSSVGVEMKNF